MKMNISGQTQRKTNQNIQVYVRVRPLNVRERCIRSAEVIEVLSPKEIVARHSIESKLIKKFTFDRTFGPESKQVEVYSSVVAPLIEEVLAGYNCTVFAYGQTGTGKTHTMVGNESAELKSTWDDDSEIGIIPRALGHLFDELRMLELEFSMRISYLELYNEELCDLLSSEDSTKIRIFDDSTKKGSVIIQGLEEIPVHSKDDVYKLLEKGKERRKTATTLMNAQSSRSHTVFSILVHIKENGLEGEEMLKIGKLNLVDLAGSENVTKAGNEKAIRVRETVNINQSLLTLGRVITALVERTPHVPYRESKLTRLLQESLGGRTKTSIIATISPGHKDIDETLSTLEYAHRAKNIQNKPEINQKLTKKTVLKEYTEEIDKLKRDLMAARDKNGIYLPDETYSEMLLKMDSQNRELNEKVLLLKAFKDEMQNKERLFAEVSLHLVEKAEKLIKVEHQLNQTKGALLQTKKILHNTERRYMEKNVILESHVKTEEVLIKQASKILEVADIATKDTHALHDTIERRKDVECKIQTVCERFTERMNNNFQLMHEKLNDLQVQHHSLTQSIDEKLTMTASLQIEQVENIESKLKVINELSDKSLTNVSGIIDDFAKDLNGLGNEHKQKIFTLLETLKQSIIGFVQQSRENFSQLELCSQQHKLTVDHMYNSIIQILNEKQSRLEAHTGQLQSKVDIMKQYTEQNRQQLLKIFESIDKNRAFEYEEQQVLEKFHKEMQDIQKRRFAEMHDLNTAVDAIDSNNENCLSELEQKSKLHFEFLKQHQIDFIQQQKIAENQYAKVEEHTKRNLAICSSLRSQLDNMHEESEQQLKNFKQNHESYETRIQQLTKAYENQINCVRLEGSKKVQTSTDQVNQLTVENARRLKNHTAEACSLNSTLQNALKTYMQSYQEQMKTCGDDINIFKQNELKTYTPSGSTPSKKEFTYPRVLATTSPHTRIIERFRQENDWSNIDTTMTIQEETLTEDADMSDSMQLLSDTEVVFNSTPVDTEVLPPKRSNCSNEKHNSNSKSLQVPAHDLMANNQLRNKLSPKKLSPTGSLDSKADRMRDVLHGLTINDHVSREPDRKSPTLKSPLKKHSPTYSKKNKENIA
uniref:Kinesin motor domain-containing protein n=1 Tax=Glossina brevipalpis TaxID=37001 RepID=A0A1A9W4K9_9MUSC